jgi:hypothetical protein
MVMATHNEGDVVRVAHVGDVVNGKVAFGSQLVAR